MKSGFRAILIGPDLWHLETMPIEGHHAYQVTETALDLERLAPLANSMQAMYEANQRDRRVNDRRLKRMGKDVAA